MSPQPTKVTFRPRLIWRVLSPLLLIAAIGSAFDPERPDDIFIYVLGGALAAVWTAYLWSARLEIDGPFLRLNYFGRTGAAVDTGHLAHFEERLTVSFPIYSPMITVRDTSGKSSFRDPAVLERVA